jgi:hypothetical protein
MIRGATAFVLRVFCPAALLAAMPLAGMAATYYVSPNGNAACSQAVSPSTPASIFQGILCVSAGDTLIALDGAYGPPPSCAADSTYTTMALYLTASGTARSPITFKAQDKWGAVLDAGNVCHSYIYFKGANSWIIQDFEIKNGHYGGIYSNWGTGGQNVIIRGNHIHNIGQNADAGSNGGAAIYTDNNATMTIDSNLIHDIGPPQNSAYNNSYVHGIYTHGSMNIVNNIFYNMLDGWAIQTADGFQGNIVNNTFYGPNNYLGGASRDGQVNLWGAAGGPIYIANNIFDLPFRDAIAQYQFSTSSTCLVANDLVHGVNTIADYGLAPICTFTNSTATNDSSTDPQFVSTAIPDFHLQAGSPAIGRATPTGASLADFDGTPRPAGNSFDIGAYQYIPNLQAWWRFAGSANDSSGNGNNGSPQNGATYGIGIDGAAISLNGSSQYVAVPGNGSLDMTDNVTVSFWVNPASVSSGDPWIVAKDYSWEVKLNEGQYPQFTDHDGRYAALNYALTPGVWAHVAFTFQSSSSTPVTGYINGSPAALSTASFSGGGLTPASSGVHIGSDSSGAAGFFPGRVDDVRVYSRVLSAREIFGIYASNCRSYGVTTSTTRTRAQVGCIP